MGKLIFVLVIGAAVLAVITLLIMAVWNLVIPSIFVGAPMIGFWQALGIMVLGRLLTYSASTSSSS